MTSPLRFGNEEFWLAAGQPPPEDFSSDELPEASQHSLGLPAHYPTGS